MPADVRSGQPGGIILVLYYADRAPLRAAIRDHLYAFRRYGGRPTVYINLAARTIPTWLDRIPVDAVIFHTILLAQRWQPAVFERLMERLEPVKRLDAVKIAIPQDEFIQTDLLCRFLREHRVGHVFTCAPEHLWPVIYEGMAGAPPTFTRVLTGYIDPTTVKRIGALSRLQPARPIDVGYRAWRPEPWLGRHGRLKGTIADEASRAGSALGLRTDISLRDEDTLIGDAWYRFLLGCRWTIGVEGGASILDRDGSIRERTVAFTAAHPDASFEEVEAACFPGLDGSFELVAISPRHLEACITGTAQVLVEGQYNGILRPWDHYVPLRADLSDLREALVMTADDGLRQRLASRAYEDVVSSRRFEYPEFVRMVSSAIPGVQRRRPMGLTGRSILAWERRLDGPSWIWVRARAMARSAMIGALRRTGLFGPLRTIRDRSRTRMAGR